MTLISREIIVGDYKVICEQTLNPIPGKLYFLAVSAADEFSQYYFHMTRQRRANDQELEFFDVYYFNYFNNEYEIITKIEPILFIVNECLKSQGLSFGFQILHGAKTAILITDNVLFFEPQSINKI